MSHFRIHPSLPIFGVQCDSAYAVYVPGHVMPVSKEMLHSLKSALSGTKGRHAQAKVEETFKDLVRVASDVQDSWNALCQKSFEPVCLNIQLPFSCNQMCVYCYASPVAPRHPYDEDNFRKAVLAAARIVAKNCARHRVPMHVDIQGMGEPTTRWDDLVWCVARTQEVSADAQVEWSGHLSTNGQIDSEQALWIGKTFNHITVSCDGPRLMQDRLRPRLDGSSSSVQLVKASGALASGSALLEVRLTITDINWMFLQEAIQYIVSELGIRVIRIEPVFAPVSVATVLPNPKRVVLECLKACDFGATLAADVSVASPNLMELHGEYCQSFRQTLRLMPDGRSANCLHGVFDPLERAVATGHYDPDTDVFLIAKDLVASEKRLDGRVPAPCHSCINIYHCARTCPDTCPLDNADTPSWRCVFQQTLAEAWVVRSAAEAPEVIGKSDQARTTAIEHLVQCEVSEIADPHDRSAIMEDTLKAASQYDLLNPSMPAPFWADDRTCVREGSLSDILMRESVQREGSLSVYVHLPFCRKRCVFCDCHSVALGRDQRGSFRQEAYMARLRQELEYWCRFGGVSNRPVTTVHFGGGTPTAIGQAALSEWVATMRSSLKTDSHTQWAIETTATETHARQIDFLMRLGFKRLHVGVQTLQDELRCRLGRVLRAEHVLERLTLAMKMGMVVSVDMIYGLPEQTASDLNVDLQRLADAGIHGISLYRLNRSERNQGLAAAFPDFNFNPIRACVMLQAADKVLARVGYRKNHFVHYALPADDNCYYRHAVRGEDLLGLGASASGAIGSFEYRNLFYPDYLTSNIESTSLFALARNPLSQGWRSLEASLLSGYVPNSCFIQNALVGSLLEKWVATGLLEEEGSEWRVSATGAWLLAEMIREVRQLGVHL